MISVAPPARMKPKSPFPFFSPFFAQLLAALLALVLSQSPASAWTRTVLSLDEGWRFHLGDVPNAVDPEYDDHDWRVVDLPHDYAIEGAFSQTNPYVYPGMNNGWYSQHAFLPIRPAVYRRSIDLPPAQKGRRFWLEFDGVCSNSRYWLNGMEIGRQYSPYSRSRFDITDAVRFDGPNELVVQVDPRYDGWWYEGAGIYRHVRLVTVNPVHIDADGVFVAPELTDPGDGIHADAAIPVQTEVRNDDGTEAGVTVLSEILDAAGRVVAAESAAGEISAHDSRHFGQKLTLGGAALWSPDSPTLYRLRTTLCLSGRIVDQMTTSFGVRQIRFDAREGFFLNGRRLLLKGVNMHQDHAGVGSAMPWRRRVARPSPPRSA